MSVAQANNADAEFGADPAPAAVDPVAAAPANPGGGGDAAPEPEQSLLEWTISSLGWMYLLIFLALSVTLVSLIVMNILAARRETLCPQELVESLKRS